MWAGIIKDELVGPCWVGDELKINSQTFCQFLEDMFFKRCYRKKSSFKKTMIITQDNAPSRASKYSSAWIANKGLKDKKNIYIFCCGSGVEPVPCYQKVAGSIPLVCMSKCPWPRY